MNRTYRLAQFLSYCYLKCFHRFEVKGLGNVPPKGGFILACNHLSYLDPPAVGCRIPRNLHYFARDSLFFGPLGLLITKLNSIPVNRDQLDLGTLRKVLSVLKGGEPVLVFPEGTRSPDGTLQKSQKGLGLLVHKSGVPVLPARLHGSFEILGKGKLFPRIGRKLYLNIGSPILSEKLSFDSSDRYQKISDLVMHEIEGL
ncbi:MAG: 1-acyl-sn-glycerol-3-phosphate acyltransferase [Rhodobacteraceae bacterium]|jgi:1-acyl-sn-glycerol-3-phosphate acyltransferase|nr:1-acyl-sn-glycerol-3-phosphate acyltransferase [Paracoccaceae bacterium]